MAFADMVKKLLNKEEDDEEPLKVVRDRQLEALRRQREVQLNEMEKRQLKQDIRAYQKEEMRKNMFGMNQETLVQKKQYLDKKNYMKNLEQRKQQNLLKQQKRLLSGSNPLNNRRNEFKKAKTKRKSILGGKYNI